MDKILFVGSVEANKRNNTTFHRYSSLLELGFNVRTLNVEEIDNNILYLFIFKFINKLFKYGLDIYLPDFNSYNNKLIKMLYQNKYDVLWIEKGLIFNKSTFKYVRNRFPLLIILGFSPDDMNARHNQSLNFLYSLKYYDYYITTKSFNVDELKNLGCKNVIFTNNGFDKHSFRMIKNKTLKFNITNNDICFIGSFEKERYTSLLSIAQNGFIVNVFGNGWSKFIKQHENLIIHNKPLYGEDFSVACNFFKINLCFLRKMNRDLQTTRSIEIPACSGFMLAERSVEHLELFKEGIEADYFTTNIELIQKISLYLSNDNLREEIAKNGFLRCKNDDYSNTGQLKKVFKTLQIL
jgi:spore maturation protein CgeB